MSLITNTLYIASDHGGHQLKTLLIHEIPQIKWIDLGTHSTESTDYPDYADSLCEKIKHPGLTPFGVLVCGSGQGMAMRANKYSYIRAALCLSEEVAKLSRQHNNANVLCLGQRLIKPSQALLIFHKFFSTDFEGGRHQSRVDKVMEDTK